MEMNFFTGGENLQTVVEFLCSAEFTGEVHGELIFLSVVNTCLSITAFLGNALILVALHKDTSIHLPSKLLYRNLAITDLCVGIIVEPLYVAYMISVVNKRRDIRRCYFVFSVADNTDCNKRGQTSRFATGSQIQTSCNFEKNTFNCYWWLDCVRCRCIYTLSESSYFFIVPLYCYRFLFSQYNLCLHKNLHVSAS